MTAVYPGSFDPTTYGHLDIIKRASVITDNLIVAILNNSSKQSLFSVEERERQLKFLTKEMPNVQIRSFTGLLVDFARQNNAKLLIRGLRDNTDFQYEYQMALTNRTLAEELETLFILTSMQYLYLSSSVVKEIAKYNGNIDGMVPPNIKSDLMDKLRRQG